MDLKRLGASCKAYRKELGLTQTEVAKEIGVSREWVSGFENGRSKNLHILAWYIDRGFKYEKIKG